MYYTALAKEKSAFHLDFRRNRKGRAAKKKSTTCNVMRHKGKKEGRVLFEGMENPSCRSVKRMRDRNPRS